MSITRNNAKRVFVLEVKGLPIRYYSGPAPSTMATHIDTGGEIAFTDVRAITNVSPYQAQLDPSGGVAEYSPVSISLAIDRKRGDSNNPHVVFERCGLRSSTTKAKITANMLHDDTASHTLNIDTDLTSLSYPRIMHIGAESVKVSAAPSNSTLTISQRGVAGTPIQSHVLQLEGVSTPEITTDITTFRGRRASLWVAIQYRDGSVSNYTELINGFIESSPVGDGHTITLNLLPLVCLIDSNVLPRSRETGLLHDYHYFQADRANQVEYMVSNVNRVSISPLIDNSANHVDLPEGGIEFSDLFDIGLVDDNSDEIYYHPRYPSFNRGDEQVFAEAYRDPNSNGKDQGFTYSDTLGEITALPPSPSGRTPTGMGAGTRRELKRFEIASDEVVQWPRAFRDAINDNAPTSISGLDGAWGRFGVVPRGDSDELLVSSYVSQEVGVAVEFWTHTNTYRTSLTADFDPTVIPGQYWENGGFPEWHIPDIERLHYGYDFQSIDSDEYPFEPILPQEYNRVTRASGRGGFSRYENTNQPQSVSSFRVRGPAKAFYQLFENSILVRDSLDLPTSAGSSVFTLKVEYYDRQAGEMKNQTFLATHQTTVSYDGSNIGYRIHLKNQFNNDNRSFGDWPNLPPAVISLADRYTSIPGNEVLLRILQNGGGSEINGEYDLGGVGLNLKTSDINLPSFEQFTNLSGISAFDGDIDNTINLRDVVDPILKSMGAAMVMKRDTTGKSKLTLVPIGLEQTAGALGSFNDTSHIYATPAPLSLIYEDIVTAINFKLDYREGDFKQEILVNNAEAIARYNEEQREITLELRGVRTEDIGNTYQEILNFFKPVFGRLFRLLSNPLRLWRFSVGTGASINTDLGAYYRITSDHLKGYGDTYGISNSIGMIRSINQDLIGEGCELELLHTDSSVAGWHDSGIVSSVIDLDTVEISANAYSDYDQLGNSTNDVDWFSPGDKVLYYPIADQSNTTQLTIDSISGNQLTFTANHGISGTGGIITPDIASNATTTQLEQAYLANASTGLLNGSLEPQEYV